MLHFLDWVTGKLFLAIEWFCQHFFAKDGLRQKFGARQKFRAFNFWH
jgi:hypothetical protein